MNAVSIAAAAIAAPIVGVEFALGGTRLQTGILRVVGVWSAAFAATAFALLITEPSALMSVTIFWFGVFLAWFGVRSHIESSILLRMLHLLWQRPMSDAELVAAYMARCGKAARIEELRRGGLVSVDRELLLTEKGQTILKVVSKLR